jgi:hypothetical protein
MKRRVRLKQRDLLESSTERSEVMDQQLRAQVLELLCALLLEVSTQEQLDHNTTEGKNT